jgi:hypothetical protein
LSWANATPLAKAVAIRAAISFFICDVPGTVGWINLVFEPVYRTGSNRFAPDPAQLTLSDIEG